MKILFNEGPWGSGSGGGGGGGKNPWGNGGGNQPPKGPDLDKIFKDMKGNLGGFTGSNGPNKKTFMFIFGAILVLYLASGIYRVAQDEKGVVTRFGKWVNTTEPGLRYALPFPIEQAKKVNVTAVNQVEVGFRSTPRGIQDIESESRMITGDKNFIDVDFVVYWVVKDPAAYIFNVRNPKQAVKDAAESAMRDVIGNTPIQRAMTDGRDAIAVQVRDLLQSILDSYGAGIRVTSVAPKSIDAPAPVVDAFNEVLRASADRDRLRNEAETFRNNIIPVARGEAEKINQDALAYKESVVNKAKGDAERFKAVYTAYSSAKDVTTTRLYLETVEKVLQNSSKIVLGSGKNGGGISPVVPYLPLPEIKKKAKKPAQSEEEALIQ